MRIRRRLYRKTNLFNSFAINTVLSGLVIPAGLSVLIIVVLHAIIINLTACIVILPVVYDPETRKGKALLLPLPYRLYIPPGLLYIIGNEQNACVLVVSCAGFWPL